MAWDSSRTGGARSRPTPKPTAQDQGGARTPGEYIGPPGPPKHTHDNGMTCWWVRRVGTESWRVVNEVGDDLGPCPGLDTPGETCSRCGRYRPYGCLCHIPITHPVPLTSTAPAASPADEGQAGEVETLAKLLGDIRIEQARQADWWTNDEDHVLLTQALRAECAAWAPGVIAAGYLSPDAVAAVTREAKAEALREAADDAEADVQALDFPTGLLGNVPRWLRARAALARTAPLQDAEEVGE